MRTNKIQKFLDYYLGIFIVFILGLFRIKRKKPKFLNDIKSIGILKPVAIGDLTLLSGPIRDIKKSCPNAEIILFVGLDNFILAPYLKGISKYVVIDVKKPMRALKKIRQNPTDILIDFCSWPRINAIISFFSKAKWTLGFKTENQHRHFCYHHFVNHSNKHHEIDNYRNLLKELDIKTSSLPKIVIKSTLKKEEKKHVIFHLFAGGNNRDKKHWPFEYWKKVFDFFSSKNYKIFLTGSEKDFYLNEEFIKFLNSPFNIKNLANVDFSKTLKKIKKADCVISVNTGIMHVAAALNVPVIGISGPTNINRWGAIGKKTYNMTPKIEGCGYLNLGFEYSKKRVDCMMYVTPEELIQRIEKMLVKK